jgi:hypothetical protein
MDGREHNGLQPICHRRQEGFVTPNLICASDPLAARPNPTNARRDMTTPVRHWTLGTAGCCLPQENCIVRREGVRSMFSGNVHAGFLSVHAEKWTRPRTLQFSCCLPGADCFQASTRLPSSVGRRRPRQANPRAQPVLLPPRTPPQSPPPLELIVDLGRPLRDVHFDVPKK